MLAYSPPCPPPSRGYARVYHSTPSDPNSTSQCQVLREVYDARYVSGDIGIGFPPYNPPMRNSDALYHHHPPSQFTPLYHPPSPFSIQPPHYTRQSPFPNHDETLCSYPPRSPFQSPHPIQHSFADSYEPQSSYADPRNVHYRLNEPRQVPNVQSPIRAPCHFGPPGSNTYHAPGQRQHGSPMRGLDRESHVEECEMHTDVYEDPFVVRYPRAIIRHTDINRNEAASMEHQVVTTIEEARPPSTQQHRTPPQDEARSLVLARGPIRTVPTPPPPCSTPVSDRTARPSDYAPTVSPASVTTETTPITDLEGADSWSPIVRDPCSSKGIWSFSTHTSDIAATVGGFKVFGVLSNGHSSLPTAEGPRDGDRTDQEEDAKGSYWCILLEAKLIGERLDARQKTLQGRAEPREDDIGVELQCITQVAGSMAGSPAGVVYVADPGRRSRVTESSDVTAQVGGMERTQDPYAVMPSWPHEL